MLMSVTDVRITLRTGSMFYSGALLVWNFGRESDCVACHAHGLGRLVCNHPSSLGCESLANCAAQHSLENLGRQEKGSLQELMNPLVADV